MKDAQREEETCRNDPFLVVRTGMGYGGVHNSASREGGKKGGDDRNTKKPWLFTPSSVVVLIVKLLVFCFVLFGLCFLK